jgi:hypothetical protein
MLLSMLLLYIDKNVCEPLIGTLLDISGKIKDTLNTWMDLEKIKLRNNLHHETLKNS